MLEVLREMTVRVNQKIETDEKVREVARAKDRTVLLKIIDTGSYIIEIKDGKVLEPREGTMDNATIVVKTDRSTFEKLLNKKLNPLMAYAMKKIKVIGPMDDIMILKDFF
ncbi:MAG: SCP2 sterol-binding domain-containing protein [Candidatus Thermoplasmatota archaeon]|nr:SCP2 sterol-binding domain-containing protein [Candidatus Thermoplasmatota archaeon]